MLKVVNAFIFNIKTCALWYIYYLWDCCKNACRCRYCFKDCLSLTIIIRKCEFGDILFIVAYIVHYSSLVLDISLTIYIVATDPAGNETRRETKLIMHDNSVTKEMMDAVCEQILSQIITKNMTTQQKLYAIYKYVVTNIKYISDSPHDDLRREAYLSLTSRKQGDCFAFCAASYELISYLGYETQIVRRDISLSKQYGNHFWVFVNCGTEENPQWYHHDASPHSKPYDLETYMMTDAQAKAYTNYRSSTSAKKHYYTFDTSLHPASATKIVVDLPIDSRYFE